MKIVFYARNFAPMVGGAEAFTMLLARGLAERPELVGGALELTLVTEAQREGFRDESLPFRVLRKPSFAELLHLVRSADVVQMAGPCFLPLLLSLLFRKPVVIEHHGYQAICPNGMLFYQPSQQSCPGHFMAGNYLECLRCNALTDGWSRSFRMLILNFPRLAMCRRATLHIPISHHVLRRLGFPRSQVIYYGIEDPLPPRSAPVECAIGAGPVQFAYVGRIVAEKGVPVLLSACAELKRGDRDFQLKIIGDGPQRPLMESSVRERNLTDRVHFTGTLRGPALEDALADVLAVVMPTLCEETAGLSAIEQMMRGRLVIVSDIGGLGEVVGDAGLKFAPGDFAGLTARMCQVLDDPGVVHRLGPLARERAQLLFQQLRMVQDYAVVYRNLAGSCAP